jgi:hypothetical protein
LPNPISAAEERRLRADLAALTRRREQHYARLDRMLVERDQQLSQTSVAAELEAKIKNLREQMAATLAELDEGPDEPPAPPPADQRQLGPEGIFHSAEEAAAAAGPWSAEFQAWRKRHIPSSRGLF